MKVINLYLDNIKIDFFNKTKLGLKIFPNGNTKEKDELGEQVITDRLHSLIFCIQLNKLNVFVDNSYGKINSFYNTWFKDSKISTQKNHF